MISLTGLTGLIEGIENQLDDPGRNPIKKVLIFSINLVCILEISYTFSKNNHAGNSQKRRERSIKD